jgi:hypothetical protein
VTTQTRQPPVNDPQRLLEGLHGRAEDRQYRLFAVACCRRIWPLLALPRSRRAVETAERHAEGEAGDRELQAAYRPIRWLEDVLVPPWAVQVSAEAAAASCAHAEAPEAAVRAALWAADAAAGAAADAVADPPGSLAEGGPWLRAYRIARAREKAAQCHLVRCIFPGAPVIEPAWLVWNGGTVRRLALAMYDRRRFDQLGMLADALEEAGCADAALLGHLRGPGPHVLGCHALDAVLGKR